MSRTALRVAVAALLVAAAGAPVAGQADPRPVVVEAALVGAHADATVAPDRAATVERRVADRLDVSRRDVRVRSETVEVTANRTPDEAAAALRDAGVEASVERGVAAATRRAAARTLRTRLDAAGVDGTVEPATVDGVAGVRVRARTDPARLRRLVTTRGRAAVVVRGPDGGERVALRRAANATADEARGAPVVDVTLSREAARRFVSTLDDAGQLGSDRCRPPADCIAVRLDGRTVTRLGLSAAFAEQMRAGEFVAERSFQLRVSDAATARRLAAALDTPALAAPARIERVGRAAPGGSPPPVWVAAGLVALLLLAVLAVDRST